MLGQGTAVAAGALPVAVGSLRHDFAALFEGFEDDPGVERTAQGVFDANLDVVEVDENGNTESICFRHSL